MISRDTLHRHERRLDALANSVHGQSIRDALNECMAELLKDLAHADLANVAEAARLQGAIKTLETLDEYLSPPR